MTERWMVTMMVVQWETLTVELMAHEKGLWKAMKMVEPKVVLMEP